jgi:two-component system, NtrC family, sensor kinase
MRGERSLVWLKVAIAAAGLLPLAFFFAVAWTGYFEAMRTAQTRLEDMTRVAEEHAARVFETNDVVLQHLLATLKDLGDEAIRRREKELHELMAVILVRLPHIESLWVWGRDGRALVSSAAFPAPAVTLSSEAILEEPVRAPVLEATRRRMSSSGELGGLVELRMQPSYFADFYQALIKDENGVTLSLVSGAGRMVARVPDAGRYDGGALTVTRSVRDQPYYVSAAQERPALLEGWRRQMLLLAAIVFPAALALVSATLFALRRTQREMEVARLLREEMESRRRAEEALRHAQKLEALGQLTGGVAHDFNNLMMVIANSCHLLAREVPVAAASRELASIERAIAAGARLTRQLLAFSRRQPLRPEVLALQRALPGMLDLLRATTGRAITVSLEVAPDTPAVEVDAAELEMALINLTANARDAMSGTGSIAIAARAGRADEGPQPGTRYAVISVVDRGQGISPENLQRVFDPFFTTKPAGSGTGLGLSQVYGFCAQAGGTVQLQSEVGVGTTAALYLPATDKAPQPEEARARGAEAKLSARVLLVEDNRDVSSTIASLLEQLGCPVTAVRSAEEAERSIESSPYLYDVVLSDVVMPGEKDGLALAYWLRQRKPELPVVLMTGYSKEVTRAAAAGIEVLPKPCAPRDIAGALAKAISAGVARRH